MGVCESSSSPLQSIGCGGAIVAKMTRSDLGHLGPSRVAFVVMIESLLEMDLGCDMLGFLEEWKGEWTREHSGLQGCSHKLTYDT
jgi:hypothetical protein